MIQGPLEADGRMAAKNAIKIRAALQEMADFKQLFQAYQETHPISTNNPAQDRARARAWVIMNVKLRDEALESAIWRMWAEAYVLGNDAASEWIARAIEAKKSVETMIDWDNWKPGDRAAATILRRPKGYQRLLERSGILMNELKRTTFQDIGVSLADAVELGLDAVRASKLIARHVGSPSRALTIAITEQNRAMTAAAIERYKQAEISKVEWEVSDPCDKCAKNTNAVRQIGQEFPSGNIQPPAHPHCRCVLLPVIPGADEVSDTQGQILLAPNQTEVVGSNPFFKAGGEISKPLRLGDDGVKEAQATLETMADFLGEEWDSSLGVKFTKFALEPGAVNGTQKVRLAQLPDGLGGAISYAIRSMDDIQAAGNMGAFENLVDSAPHLYIEYLGSTGIVPKTGTSLAQAVIKEAADNNLGIILESATLESSEFWRKMGLKPLSDQEGEAYYGLTAQEVIALLQEIKP